MGEKVARGCRRLQEVTWPGSWPRGLQRCRSVEILEAWTIAVIAPLYHDMVIHAWIPTRLPATPLMTGWNTAMSGYLTYEVVMKCYRLCVSVVGHVRFDELLRPGFGAMCGKWADKVKRNKPHF